MTSAAYVVNTGVITAIGNNTEANRKSLLDRRSGITKSEYLSTHWKDDFPVGEIKATNEELAGITGLGAHLPRTALLSAIAVQEAWASYASTANGLRRGFFSANTVGGMDLTERFYPGFKAGEKTDIQEIVNHECGAITDIVASKFGLTDFVTTISTACSSSANSIMMAAQMIEAGMLDIAVAGGADCLSRFTLNGFNTLMILDREPCKPFDNNRKGLNLGEGAGYIVLMSEAAMKQCRTNPICMVSGYANANDAYHQTASSPEGTGNKLAIKGALAKSRLNPEDIDYINLHGTGTSNNDSAEGAAITAIFGDNIPACSSTKGFTGHTLGGCGGVEAVYSTLAIKEKVIFPNLRWEQQMEDIAWKPVVEVKRDVEVRHVLSNSFGFGGNCSSLILSKA